MRYGLGMCGPEPVLLAMSPRGDCQHQFRCQRQQQQKCFLQLGHQSILGCSCPSVCYWLCQDLGPEVHAEREAVDGIGIAKTQETAGNVYSPRISEEQMRNEHVHCMVCRVSGVRNGVRSVQHD